MDASDAHAPLRAHLDAGQVIPAHPLALTSNRRLDERHQRALTRYYVDSGAGGIAVGVHTTQFAIRDHGLYQPVLELAVNTARERRPADAKPFVLVSGAVGDTAQAVHEATIARDLGYDMVLLGLGALRTADDAALLAHCREVAEVLPLFGFYLQPAVGGRVLPYSFWRALAELPRLWAIKIAPFNRYQTIDVVRAVVDAGRDDIALYTGNDDSIVADLLTPFPAGSKARRIVGGLLGQWAVWTQHATEMLARTHSPNPTYAELLREGAELTEANAAIFDAANGFSGCIAGIHEVLRRQGLLAGTWCLSDSEGLSPAQSAEIDRVCRAYPHLTDDVFIADNLDRWLR